MALLLALLLALLPSLERTVSGLDTAPFLFQLVLMVFLFMKIIILKRQVSHSHGAISGVSLSINHASTSTTPILDDKNHKILFHNLTLSFKSLSWLVLI